MITERTAKPAGRQAPETETADGKARTCAPRGRGRGREGSGRSPF